MEEKDLSHEDAIEALKNSSSIAIVGISPKEERPSYYVAKKVIEKAGKDHKIYFVNPRYKDQEILGKKVYASLEEIPDQVDLVDVFLNKRLAERILEDSIKKGAKYVWFQPGAENPEVIERYKDKISIIQNACLGVVASLLYP